VHYFSGFAFDGSGWISSQATLIFPISFMLSCHPYAKTGLETINFILLGTDRRLPYLSLNHEQLFIAS
jgi:hypothetical protein